MHSTVVKQENPTNCGTNAADGWVGDICLTALFDTKVSSAGVQFNLVILRTVQI